MGVGLAVGVAVGVDVWVGRPLGSGVAVLSVEHLALSMRQPVGWAVPLTTKPTVTDSPAARPSVSHFGGFTVTCCPLTLDSAFHSELSVAPDGRSNSSVQSFSLAPVVLVTTYCAVYPVDHSLVLVYAAPTLAAWAIPVSMIAPPPTTAAATTPPITLFLLLILRRCVLIACLLSPYGGGVRQHASDPESGKAPVPGGGWRS